MTAAATSGPLFVGVDGGGTGCRARIEDAEGSLLGTGIAGPAALRLGVDRALAEVEKACRAALEEAGLDASALGSVHAAVGLAGVGRKGALEELGCGRIRSARSLTPMTRRSPASARMARAMAASSLSEPAALALPLSEGAKSGSAAMAFRSPTKAAAPISGCTPSAGAARL